MDLERNMMQAPRDGRGSNGSAGMKLQNERYGALT